MKKVMRPLAFLLVGGAAALTSCDNSGSKVGKFTTDSGIEYQIVDAGNGPKLAEGQFMEFDFDMTDAKDSVWQTSKGQEIPGIFEFQKMPEGSPASPADALKEMAEGDSMVVTLPAKILFPQDYMRPPMVKEGDTFTMHVRAKKLMAGKEALAARFRELGKEDIAKNIEKSIEMEKEAKELVAKDDQAINDYLKKNDIKAEKTENGVYIEIKEKGDGQAVKAGDQVEVNYAGRTMKGVWFDTSIESVAKEHNLYQEGRPYQAFTFPLGAGRVIKGWDEGVEGLTVGTKATLYIPSGMAYGAQAMGDKIAANSNLVFDIEVVGVKGADAPAK